jgi:hypothetical protein
MHQALGDSFLWLVVLHHSAQALLDLRPQPQQVVVLFWAERSMLQMAVQAPQPALERAPLY